MTEEITRARKSYRGRIAPTPSGLMHLGHAQTFYIAQQRAKKNDGGILLMRIEDIDRQRCKPHFLDQVIEDLKWFGITWEEGYASVGDGLLNDLENMLFIQSNRNEFYLSAWRKLYENGCIYPSQHSRRDVERAISAPHAEDKEIIFPISLRCSQSDVPPDLTSPSSMTWRFRVPDGEPVTFIDGHYGLQSYTAGEDFGDFVVWRSDNIVSYELAVVVDDAAMNITEVVRGEDLLMSTARQILLYRALGFEPPAFYHCDLVRDSSGRRLAKRDAKVTNGSCGDNTLKSLRENGWTPERIRSELLQIPQDYV